MHHIFSFYPVLWCRDAALVMLPSVIHLSLPKATLLVWQGGCLKHKKLAFVLSENLVSKEKSST